MIQVKIVNAKPSESLETKINDAIQNLCSGISYKRITIKDIKLYEQQTQACGVDTNKTTPMNSALIIYDNDI